MRSKLKVFVAVFLMAAMIFTLLPASTAIAGPNGRGNRKPGKTVEETQALETEAVEADAPIEEVETVIETESVETVEETEAEAAYPYFEDTKTDEESGISVKVEAPEGALPDGTEMVLTALTDSQLSAVADKVDGNVVEAIDIAFWNNGEEIEPRIPIKVTMSSDNIAKVEEPTVVHVPDGDAEVEEVNLVEDAEAEAGDVVFEADSFSVYAVVWTDGSTEKSATIHWGYMDGSTFVELEEDSTVTMDTTAATMSLLNSYDGYTYRDAVYCEPGKSMAEGVDIDSTLYKATTGWECDVITTDDDTGTTTKTPIAANSNIYVIYFVQGQPNPSGAGHSDIPSPTTTKTVTPNGDGTYTIQLDIAGATVQEDESHYANILIILDATSSMNGTKWTNAKAAMKTLIETLTEGDNEKNAGKIDFALVTFGRSATVVQNWTKDNATFKTTCAGINMVTTSGTNWEAGMRGGLYGVLNSYPTGETAEKHDPTYVIFLTDGDPNTWYWSNDDIGDEIPYTRPRQYVSSSNVGDESFYGSSDTYMRPGYQGSSSTAATRSKDEAKKIAANTKLYGIYCGSSGTTPSGASYNRLVDVIQGDGQGGQKTIAANADTIESEFKKIAETMLKDMGASSVSVDDGITGLSSVSANVAGEAGGYEYYKSTDGTNFTTWAEAPGANYSTDNGVTWDLSNAGTLMAGTTYRIKFTVWPSQEAYDLLADLNNEKTTLADQNDETLEQLVVKIGNDSYEYTAGKGWSKDKGANFITTAALQTLIDSSSNVVYSVLTNTHLKTTYTFNDTTYTDEPSSLTTGAMELDDEVIGVEKTWENDIDGRTARDIFVNVTKDDQVYLENVELKYDENTKKSTASDIFISCGVITKTGTSYKIKEYGHEYTIVEPQNGYGYYWDLTAEVYRPMVINGHTTMLVKTDDVTGLTEGTDYYVIEGNKYKVSSASTSTLTAKNVRRSYVDLKKVIDGTAPEDELFPFTVTFKFPEGTSDDHRFWFSVKESEAEDAAYVTGLTGSGFTANSDGKSYYSNAATVDTTGVTVTINIKAGWSVRFLNTPVNSTYTINEDLSSKTLYTVKSIEMTGNGTSVVGEGEDAVATVTMTTGDGRNTAGALTGTVAESNTEYKATFTNKPLYFYVYHTSDKTIERIAMDDARTENGFNIVEETKFGTLYGGYFKAYTKAGMTDDQIFAATYASGSSGRYTYGSSHPAKGMWTTDSAGTAYTGSAVSFKNANVYTASGISMTPVAGTVYYLKEVPNQYFRPATYVVWDTRAENHDLKKLHMLSTTDDSLYQKVGLDGTIELDPTTRLYTTFKVTNDTGTTETIKVNIVNENLSRGFLTVWDAESKMVAGTYTMTPYFITKDGVKVTSVVTRTITIGSKISYDDSTFNGDDEVSSTYQ